MLIDYTLDLTPPFFFLAQKKEDEKIALKFPLVVVLA